MPHADSHEVQHELVPAGVPEKKWWVQLLHELMARMDDATIPDCEHIFLQLRAVHDAVGQHLTKRRQEDSAECSACGGPFMQPGPDGRKIPYGVENLIDETNGMLRAVYACSPLCLRDLQERSRLQGRVKPGNLF